MAIGLSDGRYFEDEFEHAHSLLAPIPEKAPEVNTEGVPSVDPTTPEARAFTEKASQTWPVQMIKDFVDLGKLPKDAYEGNVDLNSKEGQGRVLGAALTVASGGGLKVGGRVAGTAVKALEGEILPPVKMGKTVDEALSEIETYMKNYKVGDYKKYFEGDTTTVPIYKGYEDYLKQNNTKKDEVIDKISEKLDAIHFGFVDKLDDLVTSFKSSWQGKIQDVKYNAALKPVEWSETKGGVAAELKNAVTDPKELGFNKDVTLFKGKTGAASSKEFDTLPDPSKKMSEKGLFFSDKDHIARSYGDVEKFVVRSPKTFEVNYKELTGHASWDPVETNILINKARDKGADMLILRNINDMGGAGQSQYVLLKPENARKVNARFDPIHLHSSNLLAGLVAGGYVGKEVLKASEDTK